MAACCGCDHTITLSNDGTLHSFGNNEYGQLGLGHHNDVSLPSPITNLPKVKLISCGAYFTVCVDYEGFLWSFGDNEFGQLGTGNNLHVSVPQKIQDIPPVFSVSCGGCHTLIITNDSSLWGCGRNTCGQLFLNNQENQSKFRKTSFSNILKISTGSHHSLFQNNKGEIFSCGLNQFGQCGLAPCQKSQIIGVPIPEIPPNIVYFCGGFLHSFFLDCEGNVFSTRTRYDPNKRTLDKIPNIPSIKSIVLATQSCHMLDYEGNVWSFRLGKLKKIKFLKNIQQLSHGSYGNCFLAKDSQNKLYIVTYCDNSYQFVTCNTQSCPIPNGINAQDYQIWGNEFINEWKHMLSTSTMNWKEEEIEALEMIQSKIQKVKFNLGSNNNNKIKQEFPQNSFESWNEVDAFLNEKLKQINSKMNEKQDIELQNEKNIQAFEKELKDIENEVQRLQSRKKEIEAILPKLKQSRISLVKIETSQQTLAEMCFDVSIFCKK